MFAEQRCTGCLDDGESGGADICALPCSVDDYSAAPDLDESTARALSEATRRNVAVLW